MPSTADGPQSNSSQRRHVEHCATVATITEPGTKVLYLPVGREGIVAGVTSTIDAPDLQKPTGLKPVLDVIPDHCYQRSTVRGLGLFARDAAILALATWGLLSTDNLLLLIPLWVVAGVAVAGLFVIGHDAAHDGRKCMNQDFNGQRRPVG